MSRGTKQTTGGNVQFYSFNYGRFTRRVDENFPGAEARVLKKGKNEGKTIYEYACDEIEGAITNISVRESPFGKNLKIEIDVSTPEDPDNTIVLEFKFSSGAGKALLKKLPNIDFSKDVILKAYAIFDKEKDRTNYYITPYQEGKKIESAFTKDNPNGLPQLEKKKIKGETVWDDTEQLEFFEALISSTTYGEKTKFVYEEAEEIPEEVHEEEYSDEAEETHEEETEEKFPF